MYIYYFLIIFWAISYFLLRELKVENRRKIFTLLAGIALFMVMGLKKYTVGADWRQYLYRYHNNLLYYEIGEGEWLYNLFVTNLKKFEISDQGYIAIIGLFISISFSVFFYKYSNNIFLSFYLHLTIGLFTMSMSGIRQTLAVCCILISFRFILEETNLFNLFCFLLFVYMAYSIHNSAMVFLPAYFLKNVKITRKKGFVFLGISVIIIILGKSIMQFLSPFIPSRFDAYEVLTSSNAINPLLVLIAILIPATCLSVWNFNDEMSNYNKLFSIYYILSCINAVIHGLALNSGIFVRVADYFLVFNVMLIPLTIMNITNRKLKIIALYICIVLPLYQFTKGSIGGTLSIDNYLFFWN